MSSSSSSIFSQVFSSIKSSLFSSVSSTISDFIGKLSSVPNGVILLLSRVIAAEARANHWEANYNKLFEQVEKISNDKNCPKHIREKLIVTCGSSAEDLKNHGKDKAWEEALYENLQLLPGFIGFGAAFDTVSAETQKVMKSQLLNAAKQVITSNMTVPPSLRASGIDSAKESGDKKDDPPNGPGAIAIATDQANSSDVDHDSIKEDIPLDVEMHVQSKINELGGAVLANVKRLERRIELIGSRTQSEADVQQGGASMAMVELLFHRVKSLEFFIENNSNEQKSSHQVSDETFSRLQSLWSALRPYLNEHDYRAEMNQFDKVLNYTKPASADITGLKTTSRLNSDLVCPITSRVAADWKQFNGLVNLESFLKRTPGVFEIIPLVAVSHQGFDILILFRDIKDVDAKMVLDDVRKACLNSNISVQRFEVINSVKSSFATQVSTQ